MSAFIACKPLYDLARHHSVRQLYHQQPVLWRTDRNVLVSRQDFHGRLYGSLKLSAVLRFFLCLTYRAMSVFC